MKKTMIFAAIAAMMMQAAAVSASAEDVRLTVKTEIEVGSDCVFSGNVAVSDMNHDGKITTDEVLTAAHDLSFPGGAAAGLGSGYIWGKRGSFITEVKDRNGKLRVDNPASYEAGHAAPMYSQDVSEGDSVHCFAIALDPAHYDLMIESPELSMSVFDKTPTGSAVTFGVYYYDPAKIKPTPVSGIELLSNGKGTGIKTDQNGKATVTFSQAGDYEITGKFDPAAQGIYNSSYIFHVVDAQTVRQVQVIVRTDHLASGLNTKVNVYDADNDGSITAKDAFLCTTQIYYPVGNYPNDVFGTDGTFICNVSDANGTPKLIAPLGDDIKKTVVENGYTVEFALEGLANTQKRASVNDAAQTTTTAAATTAAAQTTTTAATTAAATTAAQTTTPAQTTVSAAAVTQTSAPAQTTAAPSTVKTDAKGNVQTGSLKTGDTAPLLACAVCILSGCTALVFRRKRTE